MEFDPPYLMRLAVIVVGPACSGAVSLDDEASVMAALNARPWQNKHSLVLHPCRNVQ